MEERTYDVDGIVINPRLYTMFPLQECRSEFAIDTLRDAIGGKALITSLMSLFLAHPFRLAPPIQLPISPLIRRSMGRKHVVVVIEWFLLRFRGKNNELLGSLACSSCLWSGVGESFLWI
jgi:hypothetical protein